MKIKLLTIWFLLLSATVSWGATYYLDINVVGGLDDGTSWANAWDTLAEAQAGVSDGDTVIVRDGSYGDYYEASVDRTAWVTYQADTGHSPEFKKIQINNQTIVRDTYLKFDGFTIRPDIDDISALEARCSKYTQFFNLNVIGQGARYTTRAFRVWENSSDIIVDNCTFSGGDNTGRFDGFAYAIHAPGAYNLTVTNNEITQFKYFGVYFHNTNVIIKNNHIHKFGGDGLMFGAGPGPLLIEDNEIHDLEIYYPVLSETPTETTWSVDGKTMTNPDANWGTASEPFNWPTTIEIVVLSGNNVNIGDHEVRVDTVTSSTEIIFDDSISSGGQPSNVDYYLRDQTHGDLMQHGISSSTDSPNVTIRGNKLYDVGNGWSFMHLQVQNTTNPDRLIGGYNWLVENNLCWDAYDDGEDEHGHPLNVRHIDGVVFRNNIVIGRVEIRYDANVTLANNIISYISVYGDSDFLANDYNIFNRGVDSVAYPAGAHTTFINEGGGNDTWDDPVFTEIFTAYPTDLTHTSAESTGVGHGDPENYPSEDILENVRDDDPDAGCYEYGASPAARCVIGNYSGSTIKYDFTNKEYNEGRWPTIAADAESAITAGASATFVNDAAHADGWTFDTADDTLWIGDTTTGTRIADNGGADAGFKIQTVEYDPGVLLKFTGSACTRMRCLSSPTDIEGELNVSALTSLTYLNCSNNSISTLDVSALTSLITLYCYDNSITTLDVSALTSLTFLHCSNNSISTLDVSALTSLITLYCYDNSITTLDVSALTSLIHLNCSSNSISTLDVSALTSLAYLYCSSTNITSFSAGAFDNLDALVKVWWYDCALITAVVDLCVTDFHTDRAAKAAMTELKLAGDNEAVTGIYQEPVDHDNPANAAEAAWVLVNDEGWTVEINTSWLPLLFGLSLSKRTKRHAQFLRRAA